VTFEWGSTSSKELERFNGRIRFVSKWNVMDYHRRRWKLMGWLARAPGFKNNFVNRIVRIQFRHDSIKK
jgi:hypothetical protein